MKLLVVATAILTLVLLALAACGNDDGQQDDGSPAPTPEASRDESVRGKALEAVREYIESVGLDGEKGTLTDPIECADLEDGAANGDYCIAEPGTYGPGLALVLVADSEQPEERGWQVRVVFENDEWHVTDAVPLASE
ncbi:MAG: hypothetical protein ACE5FA_03035 [Dehalococcoidia bacterium]